MHTLIEGNKQGQQLHLHILNARRILGHAPLTAFCGERKIQIMNYFVLQ